jgi:Tol biopolymer transport system component/DNA-binding winged helix-turn-helix (wHTH) protein
MTGPTSGPQDRLFLFSQFIADPVAGTLRHGDGFVPLPLKAFEVLMALIERRGTLVEKDELLKLVWPDTVVEENNLSRHISTLRKALNDQPPHQFIVTISGRGYRFAPPVEEVPRRALTTPPHSISEDEIQSAKPRSTLRPLHFIALAVLATVVILISTIFLSRFRRPEPNESTRKLWQLSSSGGLESDPAWAPNSDAIAYSSDRGGNFDIWVQRLGDGSLVQLTSSTAPVWQPAWSYDGRNIAFRSESDGGGLFTIPAAGGTPRRLTNFGYRPQWSRAGTILFYGSNVGRSSKLYVLDADGQPHQVLGRILSEFSSYRVAWHPDSRRISVFGTHRRDGLSFWTISLDERTVTRSAIVPEVSARLARAGVTLTDFTWAPDGDALYFEGRADDSGNIWRIQVDPRSLAWLEGPDRLTTGSGLDTNIAVSPDGEKLAFTARNERTRLWSYPFEPNEGRILADGEPLNRYGADALYPALTSDGRNVVYRVSRLGRQELRRQSLATGQEDAVVTSQGELFAPRWSNDGSMLAFRRADAKKPDGLRLNNAIVLVSATGGDERLLTTPTTRELTPYDWSADGKWILGSCQRAAGDSVSICLLPLAGAPRAQDQMRILTSDPKCNLYQATFSPNQRWIAFNAAAPMSGLSTIYTIPASGGEWTAVTDSNYWNDKPRWSPDGRTMYFVSNRSGFLNVWGRRYDPETGTPVGDPFRVSYFDTPSKRLSSPMSTFDLAIGPNHLIVPVVQTSGAIWILENLNR